MTDLSDVSFYFSVDEPIAETPDGFIYLTPSGQARFHDLSPERDSPLPTEQQFNRAAFLLRSFNSLSRSKRYGHFHSHS